MGPEWRACRADFSGRRQRRSAKPSPQRRTPRLAFDISVVPAGGRGTGVGRWPSLRDRQSFRHRHRIGFHRGPGRNLHPEGRAFVLFFSAVMYCMTQGLPSAVLLYAGAVDRRSLCSYVQELAPRLRALGLANGLMAFLWRSSWPSRTHA
jgi:hypothetical protein